MKLKSDPNLTYLFTKLFTTDFLSEINKYNLKKYSSIISDFLKNQKNKQLKKYIFISENSYLENKLKENVLNKNFIDDYLYDLKSIGSKIEKDNTLKRTIDNLKLPPKIQNTFKKLINEYKESNNILNKRFILEATNNQKQDESFIWKLIKMVFAPFTYMLDLVVGSVIRALMNIILGIFYNDYDPIITSNSIVEKIKILLYRIFDFIKKLIKSIFSFGFSIITTTILVVAGSMIFVYGFEYLYKVFKKLYKEREELLKGVMSEKDKERIQRIKDKFSPYKNNNDEDMKEDSSHFNNGGIEKQEEKSNEDFSEFNTNSNTNNNQQEKNKTEDIFTSTSSEENLNEKSEENKNNKVEDIFGSFKMNDEDEKFVFESISSIGIVNKSLEWFKARIRFLDMMFKNYSKQKEARFIANFILFVFILNIFFIVNYVYYSLKS